MEQYIIRKGKSMAKRGGLGSGLDALIPKKTPSEKKSTKKNEPAENASAVDKNEGGSPLFLPISQVEPNRDQPRKEFDKKALKELADSIKEYGILQPLLVQKKQDYYEIIAGERRWRAAKMAGLKEIPVLIRELSDQEKMEIALIENIQREDLNPIEEALAFSRLIDEFGLKQSDLAKRVSKSRTAVTNAMRLLKLQKPVQEMLIKGDISSGHARALLALEDSELQIQAAQEIVDQGLSVRDTEKLVKKLQTQADRKPKAEKQIDPEREHLYRQLEENMKSVLGTQVRINNRGNKGKIEIEYYSQDDLDRLLVMIQSISQD